MGKKQNKIVLTRTERKKIEFVTQNKHWDRTMTALINEGRVSHFYYFYLQMERNI